MPSFRYALASLLVSLAGCSAPTAVDGGSDARASDAGPLDTGSVDASASDAASDGGVDEDGGITIGDSGADAPPSDAPPPPPFAQVDDGTVALAQRIPCVPALAFRADGTPLLGITDGSFRVVQLVDGAWAQLGPDVNDVGSTITSGQCPAITVGADDAVFAAFQVQVGATFRFAVRRFDGSAWQDTVSLVNTGALAVADLDMDRDAAGEPVVAVLEPNPSAFGYAVAVRRWVGGTFVREPMLGSVDVSELRIAVRPDDSVLALITHVTGPFSGAVGVIELADGVWTNLGDVENRGDTTTGLEIGGIAADATGFSIGWLQTSSAGVHAVHVSRHESGAYTSLDARFAALPLGLNPAVAHGPDGALTLAVADDGRFVMRRLDDGAPEAPITVPGFGFLIAPAYDGEQLYAAVTTSFGGGSANAFLFRVDFP